MAPQDRPRRSRAERRQLLLTQSSQLFAAHGYSATSLAQIAAAAGVSESIVNRNYAAKADLFRDLLDELLSTTLRAWRDETEEMTDPLARLHALAERYLESTRTHSSTVQAILRCLVEGEEEVQGSLRSFALEWEDFLAGLIAKGQQSGFFRRSLDPRVGAWQLMHAALAATLTRPLSIPLHEQTEYTAQAIECALHCLLKTDV